MAKNIFRQVQSYRGGYVPAVSPMAKQAVQLRQVKQSFSMSKQNSKWIVYKAVKAERKITKEVKSRAKTPVKVKESSLYTKVYDEAAAKIYSKGISPLSYQATKWFRLNVKRIAGKTTSHKRLLNDPQRSIGSVFPKHKIKFVGNMFMFIYRPKGELTLPHYDKFPLVIPIRQPETINGEVSFLGLNLHYLSPKMRALFFDKLTSRMSNRYLDDNTRFRISYEYLNQTARMRFFRPCVKRYIVIRVTSRIIKVPSSEWTTALFLGSERFVNANKTEVWSKSRDMLS